jgi:predicted RecB family endonuclease
VRQADVAARAIGIAVQHVMVRGASDFDRAFAELRGASAVIQLDDVLFTSHRKQLVDLGFARLVIALARCGQRDRPGRA